MLALKSLVVASAFALMVHPAIAANDSSGGANGVQEGFPPAGARPPAASTSRRCRHRRECRDLREANVDT